MSSPASTEKKMSEGQFLQAYQGFMFASSCCIGGFWPCGCATSPVVAFALFAAGYASLKKTVHNMWIAKKFNSFAVFILCIYVAQLLVWWNLFDSKDAEDKTQEEEDKESEENDKERDERSAEENKRLNFFGIAIMGQYFSTYGIFLNYLMVEYKRDIGFFIFIALVAIFIGSLCGALFGVVKCEKELSLVAEPIKADLEAQAMIGNSSDNYEVAKKEESEETDVANK